MTLPGPWTRLCHVRTCNSSGVPLARMCNEHFSDSRERILMKNIAYAGALVALLNIELPIVEQLLAERFASKKGLRESNTRALMLGAEYASETSIARFRSTSAP